jgi:hypothetical protein
MFFVRDTQEDRHLRIRGFLNAETATIAMILAIIDLEWTIRRVIDHAGSGDDAAKNEIVSGFNGYSRVWRRTFGSKQENALDHVCGNPRKISDAFHFRNQLVHGKQGSAGVRYVETHLEAILGASRRVAHFGRERGADPFKRLRKRGSLTALKSRKN